MPDLASKADLPGLLSFPKGAQKQLLKCHPNVSATLAHNPVQRSETWLLGAAAFTMTLHTHAAADVGLSYSPLLPQGSREHLREMLKAGPRQCLSSVRRESDCGWTCLST